MIARCVRAGQQGGWWARARVRQRRYQRRHKLAVRRGVGAAVLHDIAHAGHNELHASRRRVAARRAQLAQGAHRSGALGDILRPKRNADLEVERGGLRLRRALRKLARNTVAALHSPGGEM